MDLVYLIIGPSGSGKSTVVDILQNTYNWKPVESYTTRPRREANERGHIFINKDEFDALEHKVAYTLFDEYEYCATQAQLDMCQVYIIDPPGYEELLKRYTGTKKIVTIYLEVNQRNAIQRMTQRGDSFNKAMQRAEHDSKVFFKNAHKYDLYIDTNILDANEIASIIYLDSLVRKGDIDDPKI